MASDFRQTTPGVAGYVAVTTTGGVIDPGFIPTSLIATTPMVVIFNATTSAVWTKPAGLKYVRVRLVGGGAGGSQSSGSSFNGGAGASSGTYVEDITTAAVFSATTAVTIGASVSGHTAGNDSTFGVYVAKGGLASGATQSGSVGGFLMVQGAGEGGMNWSNAGNAQGGRGGSNPLSQGGWGGIGDATGNTGTGPGAAGGGGSNNNGSQHDGGAGNAGILILELYFV